MAKENKKDIFDYEAAPESTGHVHIKEKYDLFINNKWTKPQSEEYFDTINPANEKRISSVARANEKDVDRAVKAARKAFPSWSLLSGAVPRPRRARPRRYDPRSPGDHH